MISLSDYIQNKLDNKEMESLESLLQKAIFHKDYDGIVNFVNDGIKNGEYSSVQRILELSSKLNPVEEDEIVTIEDFNMTPSMRDMIIGFARVRLMNNPPEEVEPNIFYIDPAKYIKNVNPLTLSLLAQVVRNKYYNAETEMGVGISKKSTKRVKDHFGINKDGQVEYDSTQPVFIFDARSNSNAVDVEDYLGGKLKDPKVKHFWDHLPDKEAPGEGHGDRNTVCFYIGALSPYYQRLARDKQ
ncbi:MAG: hypothetical protein J1F38_09620 [Muribaculaceae bacterium]|nr:hypothetical protein [Muribaculaceae bacterium]